MDPGLLRTFVAVAGCGSFSAAARHLGYTQSAVSQQIAALEGALGATLLHRRPVGPTEAGERLLEHAAPILLRMEAARADVRRAVAGSPGQLLLGVTPLAVRNRLAHALAGIRRSTPGLDVTVRVAGRRAVLSAVATGDCTLGLVDGVVAPSDPLNLPDVEAFDTVAIAEEPLVVALPDGHPLARRTTLRLEDLLDAHWVDAPDAAAALPELRAAAQSDGPDGTIRYEGTDTSVLLALVATGHGLAILPRSAATGQPGIAATPLTSPRLIHRTELIHGRATGPAASAFVSAITGQP